MLSLVTMNLRLPVPADGQYFFFSRLPFILKKIRSEMPDILCFQLYV